MKQYKIAVAGTGYVGLVAGVCFAEMGHKVICVDLDEKKVAMMKSGVSPIYEQDLEELMRQNNLAGRLDYTTDFKSAYKYADAIFIGVGTPEQPDGSVNISYIETVARQIAETIEKDCLVVVKSTVPVGINDKIEQLIKGFLVHNVKVEIASNPEFLSQGTAVRDTLKAARVVIGTESKKAEAMLREIYEPFGLPIVSVKRKSAEMIKYASNDFLALKISYINEIANLCELVGANIEEVTKGMSYDQRIGDKFLKAGIGYGGSCFPKDTKALNWLANCHGYELKTVKAAIEVNESQKIKLLKKAHKYYNSFSGLTIAVLGLTFKPETDDIRDAPSLQNIPLLLEEGAYIKAWDPVGMSNFKKLYSKGITFCDTIQKTIKDADICFIFTEWSQVVKFDISLFKKLMRAPIVIDGRNCYQLEHFERLGINYESIGRTCKTRLAISRARWNESFNIFKLRIKHSY